MATVVTFIVTPGANFKVKANGEVIIKLMASKEAQAPQWSKNVRENEKNG